MQLALCIRLHCACQSQAAAQAAVDALRKELTASELKRQKADAVVNSLKAERQQLLKEVASAKSQSVGTKP